MSVTDVIAVAGPVVSQLIFQKKKILKIQWFIILGHVLVNKEEILGSHILSMEIWHAHAARDRDEFAPCPHA